MSGEERALCLVHDPAPEWLLRTWQQYGYPAEPPECVCSRSKT